MTNKKNPHGIPVEQPSVVQSKDNFPVDDLPTSVTQDASKKSSGISIDIDKSAKQKQTAASTSNDVGGSRVSVDGSPTVMTDKTQVNSQSGLMFDPEPETQVLSKGTKPDDSVTKESPVVDEPATSIARPKINKQSSDDTEEDAMNDPIAGWLVVVSGPGKGNALKMGYGQNSIGRDTGQRVALNFGDAQVSRTNHATVTYDPRGNQFYIQPGSGTNLTYISGQRTPVMQPQVLEPHSHISLGDTILRFVPLCGETFTWDMAEKE